MDRAEAVQGRRERGAREEPQRDERPEDGSEAHRAAEDAHAFPILPVDVPVEQAPVANDQFEQALGDTHE